MKMEINKIYNNDCISGMKNIESNSVDLIITSPPYNLNINYADYNDSMKLEMYYNWCREWIVESFRILKDGGRFCLQIGAFQSQLNEPSYATFTNIFQEIGFTFRELIIWNKNQIPKRTAWGSWMSPSNPRILPPFEMIINFHKGSPKILEKGTTDLTKEEFINWTNGLWVMAPESAKKRNHPAPYPEEFAYRCIKMHSYIGALVVDPFNGSGTTTAVAKKLGRNYIGFDITEDYCKLAEVRLNAIP
jgi:site-specific DNA-methyltransferase (adenine-specific)